MYYNLVFPIGDLIILIILYALAIKYRKVPSKHMRYMIATSLVLIDPIIGRIAFNNLPFGSLAMPIAYALMNGILLLLIWMDYKNKKDYSPYIHALICFILYHISYFLVYYII
ncbi:hypothetical protein [Neotamlana nanhaiensis]|nr:hypothetical protein [Tamlana nanhaiensis]